MKRKRLIPEVVVGKDITDCLILAAHPDERMEPDDENPSLTRRTIVLRFDGERVRGAASLLPSAVHRGWSSTGGAGYCSAVQDDQLYVCVAGQWHRERFSKHVEDVYFVGGLSGVDAASDIVYVSTGTALFVRRAGQWKRFAPPKQARPLYGSHGRSPNELYVCTDAGLMLFNGAGFEELEDPPKEHVESVLVVGEQIYAGETRLSRWTEASGWEHCKPEILDVTGLIAMDDAIVVGTFEKGVFDNVGKGFVAQTPPFMCLGLQRIGGGAFACGDEGGYVRVAGRWRELVLPLCAAGELPDPAR